MRSATVLLFAGLLGPSMLSAQKNDQSSLADGTAAWTAPLFASQSPLTITIEAPFGRLFSDRDEEAPEREGTLSYENPDGSVVSLGFKLELRGHNRRSSRICSFPPLRINFPKSQVGETVFAGQDKLKLVTQCRENRDRYQQYLMLEFLAYRIYNVLTPMSFNVRLAEITYEDSEGDRDTITRYAFILEDADAMAARNGWDVLNLPSVPPAQMDPAQLGLVEMFQFMIGHADWSAFVGKPGDNKCCHNGRLIGTMQGPVFPVPYDFDFAGLVDARYAVPVDGQRNVRQRTYRGVCRDRTLLMETLWRFTAHRAEIEDLVRNQVGLDERHRDRALEYLDDFYKIVDDPDRVEREFVRGCRRIG